MKKEITVKQAIRRGHWTVNVPVFFALFTLPGIAFYFSVFGEVPDSYIGLGLLLGFPLAWLCWSVLITKWRLWAFENVRNVHDLKEKAILAQLIYPDDKWYGKTEIRSAFEKRKWAEIERKFERPDVFKAISSVPEHTEIFHSKSKVAYSILLGLFGLGIGALTMINRESRLIGVLFGSFGIYFILSGMKKFLDPSSKIILNNKGLMTSGSPFYEWSQISNEKIIIEGSGKSQECYLVYNHPNGSERLSIANLDTDYETLEGLLRTYRVRYSKGVNR